MPSNLKKSLAPVIVFVYNRPEHTQRTISALLINDLAQDTDVIIFSDAAKTPLEREAVDTVRNYVDGIKGFRSLKIIKRTENYGLARSIIEGVTEACEKFGRVIVLEDDLITSRYFLKFMNDALDHYSNIDQVMHVSGCAYPIQHLDSQQTYFLRVPLCWGWGTWQRAWKKFSNDHSVMDKFNPSMIREFNFQDTYPYWTQLEWNKEGKMKTWFIFWYASVFLSEGLSLFPNQSLVRNIGFDNTGVNCGVTSKLDVVIADCAVTIEDIPLEVSKEGFRKHIRYFKSIKPTLLQRLSNKIKRLTQFWLEKIRSIFL